MEKVYLTDLLTAKFWGVEKFSDLLTAKFWGPDGPIGTAGPMLVLIIHAIGSSFYVLVVRIFKPFAPMIATGFTWAALTAATHFEFTIWEQYKIVIGVFYGVFFSLTLIPSK
jgi:hypothetical protein